MSNYFKDMYINITSNSIENINSDLIQITETSNTKLILFGSDTY